MPWPEERGMVLGDRSCGAGRGAAGTSRPSCPSSGSRISIFSYHGHTQTPPPAPSRGELQVFLLHPQESRFLSDFLFWAIGLLPSSGSAGRAGEPRGLGGGTASSWGRCSKGSCWLGGSTGGVTHTAPTPLFSPVLAGGSSTQHEVPTRSPPETHSPALPPRHHLGWRPNSIPVPPVPPVPPGWLQAGVQGPHKARLSPRGRALIPAAALPTPGGSAASSSSSQAENAWPTRIKCKAPRGRHAAGFGEQPQQPGRAFSFFWEISKMVQNRGCQQSTRPARACHPPLPASLFKMKFRKAAGGAQGCSGGGRRGAGGGRILPAGPRGTAKPRLPQPGHQWQHLPEEESKPSLGAAFLRGSGTGKQLGSGSGWQTEVRR